MTAKPVKPNTILPPGGRLITPRQIKKKIGGWVPMVFDAEVTCIGIRWFRVKDGMSGRGDREDWVADIPNICTSVHDYQWRAPFWGLTRYPSFQAACRGELKRALKEATKELAKAKQTMETMKVFIKRFSREVDP